MVFNPFLNCPPLPSKTQTQTITFGTAQNIQVPARGQLVLSCGVTLGPLNAASLLYDLQNALSLNFPGAVVMGQTGTAAVVGPPAVPGAQGVLTVYFPQDPLIPIAVVTNTLMDGGSASISATIAANPGVLYPNYTYLTTRWSEFLIPGTPTPQQLQQAEMQLLALKTDAWRYVQPKNWNAWATTPSGNTPFVQGTFLMIAHLKKLSMDPVGFVVEQQANKLRESYSDDKFLMGTVYGQQFIRLRDSTIVTTRFIGAGGGVGPIIGNQSGGFEGPHNGDYQPIN